MNKREFLKKVKGFKPEFGNPNHLRVLELLDKFKKKEALAKNLLTKKQEVAELNEEIEYDLANVAFLMDKKN